MFIKRPKLYAARDQFSRMLKAKTKETDWQDFFTENPYIFSSTLPISIDPYDIVSLGRPGKAETDFIFYPHKSHSKPIYGAIELKKPSSKIITNPRKDIITLTRDADTAVKQATFYAEKTFKKYYNTNSNHIFLGNKIHAFVIMGLSNEITELLCKDIFEKQLKDLLPENCLLYPFDTLYEMFDSKIPPKIWSLRIIDEAIPQFIKKYKWIYPGQGVKYNKNISQICCFIETISTKKRFMVISNFPDLPLTPIPVFHPEIPITGDTQDVVAQINHISPIKPFVPDDISSYNYHAACAAEIFPETNVSNKLPEWGAIKKIVNFEDFLRFSKNEDFLIPSNEGFNKARILSNLPTIYLSLSNIKYIFVDCFVLSLNNKKNVISGSPVLTKDGGIGGMIFAKSILKNGSELYIANSIRYILKEFDSKLMVN